ncbi:hypothetical protein FKP32DRAFT_1669731 [Trametes sanguinea]|nr:hypothetical protein FKP32DRAFT_1669731 [Trametes sanguinea]
MFTFRSVVNSSYLEHGRAKVGELIVYTSAARLVALHSCWQLPQLRSIASGHNLGLPEDSGLSAHVQALVVHSCTKDCPSSAYLFRVLKNPRKVLRARPDYQDSRLRPVLSAETESGDICERVEGLPREVTDASSQARREESMAYLSIANEDLRCAIITEWEQAMSTARLQELVCAIAPVKASRIPFDLLQNPDLPAEVLPRTYNRAAYEGALLHPKGLTYTDRRGPVNICQECRDDLFRADGGRMPRYALANWLYYGHDALPDPIRGMFRSSTQVERTLISRARSSKVSYKFCEMVGHPLYGTDPRISQGCMKGNVAIHPQDATHLTDVLPLSYNAIRDTVCAVFVGKTAPTKENIRKLSPVLVRKSRVKSLIEFLIAHNPEYAISPAFRGFSEENMADLFRHSAGAQSADEDVLSAMEIGHIQLSDAVEGATASYVPGAVGPDPNDRDTLLMENVGYTAVDGTLVANPREMTVQAVSHCLKGHSFIRVQAGSRFIPDFHNPSLLSWLFPHLDPWGIGGFHHPGRARGRQLTLEQQLRYLLQVDDSPFKEDPKFAFVYYNIQQKKAVVESLRFRVAESHRDKVIGDLLQLDVKKVDKLAQTLKSNPLYKSHDSDEKEILRLLARVNTVSHDLPGSNGYKQALRNQIRGLIYHEGTPTLFVTLNPSDRDHPLVRLYAGHEIVIEDHMRGEELDRWQRTQFAARNPAACARFFDTMITNFINIVLRFGRDGKGLFGKCKAYYGTMAIPRRSVCETR